MQFDGEYNIVSRFYKIGKHRGKVIVKTEGNTLTGVAVALGKESPLHNGIISGNDFTCDMDMAVPFTKRRIKMMVKGKFTEDSIQGTMMAPFGKSEFEGRKTS